MAHMQPDNIYNADDSGPVAGVTQPARPIDSDTLSGMTYAGRAICDERPLLDFLADYTGHMLGCGVNTLRVIRCTKRIGEAFGLGIEMTSTSRHFTLSVRDSLSCKSVTRVVSVPPLPISFRRNADLSALSWQAFDECLSLDELRRRFNALTSQPRLDPMLTLLLVSLANACFCALFGGDLTAMVIVFVATLIGFAVRQRLAMNGVNQYLVFMASAFVASMCASIALRFDCTAHIAIATSPLFLIPGVPLINGVIDIVDHHSQVGISRLVNAMLLILCLAIGLSATMLIVKSSLL